jgi:hypothetical protein
MRCAVAAMLAVGALLRPIAALADDATHQESSGQSALGADQIQFAAHEHDLGYRAYLAKLYGEAATHFENAFFAAPNPAELRYAIRARRDAAEPARAATLAAIGQRKFAADASMSKLAEEVVAEARPSVYEVRIASETECSVAVDEKIVAVEKVKTFRFFVTPGKHELRVSWSDDRTKTVAIDAKPGASQTLELEAPAPPGPIPPQPSLPIAPPVPVVPVPPVAPTPPPPAEAPSTKPLGPAVFIVGAALTAVGVGLTVWSGIDAQRNPGANAVKADCVGLGQDCPEYQDGLSAQRRTNILLAATGGVAVVTAAVGVFFTRWPGGERGGSPAAGGRPVHVEPVFGFREAALRGTF